MVNAALVSDNSEIIEEIKKISHLNSFNLEVISDISKIEEVLSSDNTDVMIFDAGMKDIISVLRKIKLQLQTKDIRSIAVLPEKDIDYECLKYTNTYIKKPVDEKLFISTLNSCVQLRETFRVLSKNNNDLAKSLYQLNVLYTTSAKLAGSLDKTNLVEIITDGLDQSLSLSLCYALILNEVNDIKLIVKSLFQYQRSLKMLLS